MDYKLLKALLDNILENFKCQNCNSKTSEENIEIIWVAWKNVNLNVKCSSCSKSSIIKAQANEVKLNWLDKQKLDFIKSQLEKRLGGKANINIVEDTSISSIENTQINELGKKLKQDDTSIEDLLK
jgi:transcription elongation factor Elf1